MSALHSLVTSPLLVPLGWTLLHSLWQGLAGAILLATTLRLMRRRSAAARYVIAMSALLLLLLSAVTTFGWLNHQTTEVRIVADNSTITPLPSSAFVAIPIETPSIPDGPVQLTWQQRVSPMLPWAGLFWAIGVAALGLYQFGGWLLVQRLRRGGVAIDDASARAIFNELLGRLRITKPIRLTRSAAVQVPTVIGWLRPIVLLPINALTGLSTDQLRGLLAHELAHVRRFDYLINILQTIIETLLFYHPAIWWIGRVIRQERENACDDLAAEICDRTTYAQALATMEQLRQAPAFALSARGGTLLPRIKRILGVTDTPKRRGRASSIATALVLLGVVAALVGINACNSNQKDTTIKPAIAATQPETLQETEFSSPTPDDLKTEDYRLAGNGNKRTFHISGAVNHPGEYGIPKSDFRLLDAIIAAQGTTDDSAWLTLLRVDIASKDHRRRIRVDLNGLRLGDLTQNIVIHNGDEIVVPEPLPLIYYDLHVSGHVKSPGAFLRKEVRPLHLTALIKSAGGFDDPKLGDDTNIVICGHVKNQIVVTNYKWGTITKDASNDPVLGTHDTIYVQPDVAMPMGKTDAINSEEINREVAWRAAASVGFGMNEAIRHLGEPGFSLNDAWMLSLLNQRDEARKALELAKLNYGPKNPKLVPLQQEVDVDEGLIEHFREVLSDSQSKEVKPATTERAAASHQGQYYISGVPRAGTYAIEGKQITLIQSLWAAGFSPTDGKDSRIDVKRLPEISPKQTLFRFTANEIFKSPPDFFILAPGDIVLVHEPATDTPNVVQLIVDKDGMTLNGKPVSLHTENDEDDLDDRLSSIPDPHHHVLEITLKSETKARDASDAAARGAMIGFETRVIRPPVSGATTQPDSPVNAATTQHSAALKAGEVYEVYLTGHIKQPGLWERTTGKDVSVSQMIEAAGGFDDPKMGDDTLISLVQHWQNGAVRQSFTWGELKKNPSRDPVIHANDVIDVVGAVPPPSTQATIETEPVDEYVISGVPRTGIYSLHGKRVTVLQAIVAAGGDPKKLNNKEVLIYRRSSKNREDFLRFTMNELLDDNGHPDFLKPNDVVLVQEDGKDPPSTRVFGIPATQSTTKHSISSGQNK